MKRKWFSLAAVLAVILVAGCCPEIRGDVTELRKLHAAYRSAVVPRADLEAAKVEVLADKLDGVMANLEELTK